KRGARFDSWEEHFDLPLWNEVLDEYHVDREAYLGTRAVDAAQPWDHIDVGLAEGFLAWEYRRALKNRLSPPCGKPNKTLLHHTNLEDAEADQRKLVCYDCGIACDLGEMRTERIDYLTTLGAHKRVVLPVLGDDGQVVGAAGALAPQPPKRPIGRGEGPLPTGFQQEVGRKFRIRFEKRGRGAFIAHLDTMRLLVRAFRRARIELEYSKGYHPKPVLVFGPALGLGVGALGELVDVRVIWDGDAAQLLSALAPALPDGMAITDARQLEHQELPLGKVIGQALVAAWLPNASELRTGELSVTRRQKGEARKIDVSSYLIEASLADATTAAGLRARFDWPEGGAILLARVRVTDGGGVKPLELVEALVGSTEGVLLGRVGLYDELGQDPMVTTRFAPPKPPSLPQAALLIDVLASN
ncbi:MAG: TIGR03936 family radical SAM-associated protein, partial [Polyangia bacterium]